MDENRPVLALETSETLCGACVYFSELKYFEASVHLKNSHAEKLFEAVDFVIKSAGLVTGDLAAVAVSAGPGSFTGLRIGMSAAKGIAFGSSLPIIPVPTFEAMALEIKDFLSEGAEFIIANKVNVEEIYYAKFQIKSNNYIFADGLRIIRHPEFLELAQTAPVFGNAVKFLSGKVSAESRNFSAPPARMVGKWSKLFGEGLMTTDYDYIEPNYLKNFIIKERKNV